MPAARYPVPEIQSWTPSLEVKAVENGSIFVLEGVNYLFDSKGPKSGFGSRLLTGGALETNDRLFESRPLGDRQLIFTGLAVYIRKWTYIDEDSLEPSVEEWVKIYDLPAIDTGFYNQYHWTVAYVGHGSYACHPAYGIFKYLGDGFEVFNPPGLPESPIAVGECSGRLIVMGRYVSAWSGPFNGDDFTPELGGSGFQSIQERVPGDPLVLTTFQGGFLTWTSQGIMLSEFVGGDAVFRHDRVFSDQLMLNPYAYTKDADGNLILMTAQGLYKSNPTAGMTPMTPVFNVFLRTEINSYSDYRVSMEFFKDDLLFVQITDDTSVVVKTYVLNITLDKWGEFSVQHRGICQWTVDPGDYGYVDIEGFGHRFQEVPWIEDPELNLQPLESRIELGYFRPANGGPVADLSFELQGMLISGVEKKTALQESSEIQEDWGSYSTPYNAGFYIHDEDWNAFGVSDFDENWNNPGVAEDWNNPGAPVDWNDTVAGARDFDWNNPGPSEDWNLTPDGGVDTDYIIDWQIGEGGVDEDWNKPWSNLNRITYDIEMKCSLDGFETDLVVIPPMAVEKNKSDLWSMLTSGHHHRMVISANQIQQKYHVTHLEVTINSNGRYA